MVSVRCLPRAVGDGNGSIAERCANDGHKYGWKSHTPECQHKDLDSVCGGGIMAVVICCNRTPSGGRGEADGQEGEEGTGKTETRVEARGVRVNVRRSLPQQDTEKDEGYDPGIFLESMNHGEAEDRHQVGDHRDNDTANADSQGIVRDSAEGLTTNDDVDNSKTTSDKDVENRAQFGAPEAKGISGCSNGTETKLDMLLVRGSKVRESGTLSPLVPRCRCNQYTWRRGMFQQQLQQLTVSDPSRTRVQGCQWAAFPNDMSWTTT